MKQSELFGNRIKDPQRRREYFLALAQVLNDIEARARFDRAAKGWREAVSK